ncbi:MAG: hypothetical protein IKW59_05065 [Clostridia bacterium]|nr:hypothetical protein [Clostridia bacterium]
MSQNSENTQCETCAYYDYDGETDDYGCSVSFDEDDISLFYSGGRNACPYYRFYDEYKMVKKQN